MKLKSITYDSVNQRLLVTIQREIYGDTWALGQTECDGENLVWDMCGVDNQCSLVCCNEMSSSATKFKIKDTWDLDQNPLEWYLATESFQVSKSTQQSNYTVYNSDGTSTTGYDYLYVKENILEVDLSTSFIDINKDLLFVFITIQNNTKQGRPVETFVFPYYLPSAYNKLILSSIKNNFITDCCKGLDTCTMNHLIAKYGFEYALNLVDCQKMIKYWNILHENNNTKTTNSGCGCGR